MSASSTWFLLLLPDSLSCTSCKLPSPHPCCPCFSQVLRLLLALALSHAKVAGASEGPAALAKAAPAWAPAFVRAPPAELMPFIRSLISYPGGADVARPFSQQMLGALGRCLLAGEHRQRGHCPLFSAAHDGLLSVRICIPLCFAFRCASHVRLRLR